LIEIAGITTLSSFPLQVLHWVAGFLIAGVAFVNKRVARLIFMNHFNLIDNINPRGSRNLFPS
jgi:hypothetical protein